MSANPIIDVCGATSGEYRTAFGTEEGVTIARTGDHVHVSGLPPYDGTWRLTRVWRAAAGSPPRMVYGIGEDLFAHFGAPEGWPAPNRAPLHNVSGLTVLGASSANAVSGPQKMYLPTGALVSWRATTAGRSAQTFSLKDASGKVVASATGASPDGSLRLLGSGELRARGDPYHTLSFDAAARILPSTDPLLHDRKLYVQTHKLLTDRTAQDAGFRDMMVEIEVFGNHA